MQEFIEATIREAGAAVMKHFGHATVAYTKEDANDVVTKADLESNEIIKRAIAQKFAEHAIVSEEDPVKSSNDDHGASEQFKWFIDPIDGTKNFSTHVPLFGIMIALTHRGEVTHGAIYLPVTDELIYAEAGKGAWMNGKQLTASSIDVLANTFGVVGSRMKERSAKVNETLVEASGGTLWLNALGCKAVSAAYVAMGRRDWMISLVGGGAWDYAAPYIILKEAGYIITDIAGTPWQLDSKAMIVANATIHPQILKALQ